MTGVSTASIDYLQRSGQVHASGGGRAGPAVPGTHRRLVRVRRIGVQSKWPEEAETPFTDRFRTGAEDLVAGCYGARVPLAFGVSGGSAGIHVAFGTWSSRPDVPAATLEGRVAAIASILRGLYPVVDLSAEQAAQGLAAFPLAGFALGVPTPKRGMSGDRSAPIDRVIRAMAGTTWALQVLAYPVDERATAQVRNSVVNEIRLVEAAARSEGAPSPMTEQYVELLKLALKAHTTGMTTGSWRTAVYLLGDGESYARLAGVWRSVFSGDASLPEPVRVFRSPTCVQLADAWTMEEAAAEPGPGSYTRPFEHQTLLNSDQVAAYVHLPRIETAGFAVDLAPDFDVVPGPSAGGEGLVLGAVVNRGQVTDQTYRVALASLTRHVFVSGVTGAGKSNTVFNLLDQVNRHRVPFLVIEPAKAEYRTLLDHPRVGPGLQVFTLGDETISPLRLNPFEVLPGTPVLMHLDLLRSVFTASFGMWNPLPQILERCLYAVYEDRGWDVTTGTNRRLDDPARRELAFPTLADLTDKVDEVIRTLGYDEKITSDMRAALLTRLASLRVGGKGRMLDTQTSMPPEALFEWPTVLELERLGDDDDKAFVIGLVLIRLAEYRRQLGYSSSLRHLLVLEEAHRLLSNTGPQASAEQGDPMFKAVQSFVNLLAEIRVYGQGVVVADQVPVRLAPEVIKNTNLKLTHRLVALDDRSAVGSTMAMDDRRARLLTTLTSGEAAVFAEGDDAPLLIRVPLVKDLDRVPSDADIVAHMAGRTRVVEGTGAGCPDCGQLDQRGCRAAGTAFERPEVRRAAARVYATLLANADAVDRLWPGLVETAGPWLPDDVDEARQALVCLVAQSTRRFTEQRGARSGWTYGVTEDVRRALYAVLPVTSTRPTGDARSTTTEQSTDDARRTLAELSIEVHRRATDPFPRCGRICPSDPPLCLYRRATEQLLPDPTLVVRWQDAEALPFEERYAAMWEQAQDIGLRIVEFPDAAMDEQSLAWTRGAARRVSLCYAQQKIASSPSRTPELVRVALDRLLDVAAPAPDPTPEEER